MSVLIKGMEMPSKKAIAVVIHPDGTAYLAEMFAGVCTEYLADCTAVPVPPHGDLIDRDVAYDKIAEQDGGNYVDMDAEDKGPNETPVIIPEDDAWPEWRTQVLGIRRQEEGIRPGQIWRHFKGGVYRVLYLAKHCETAEELVIYTSDDGGGAVWARPAYMWLETVECDGKNQPRFELIFDPSSKEAPGEDINATSKPYDLLYEEGGASTT